jgi:hypothetical protein
MTYTYTYEEFFQKMDKPFKSFVATYTTRRVFDMREFKQIVEQFKEMPILTNIQYVKRKYHRRNYIAVSFKTDGDEAVFMLLASGGIKLEYKNNEDY